MSAQSVDIRDKPWWMPEVIEWVDNYIDSDMTVLEFGCGASTIWLAKRCTVISVEEESLEWFDAIGSKLREMEVTRAGLFWKAMPIPKHRGDLYDMMILDGGDRVGNFIRMYPWVKDGGIIMLDDSERIEEYKHIFNFMHGLPRRDFLGELDGKEGRRTTIWKKNQVK
jgi:hypothetical protein